jgi:hypothetical protein
MCHQDIPAGHTAGVPAGVVGLVYAAHQGYAGMLSVLGVH